MSIKGGFVCKDCNKKVTHNNISLGTLKLLRLSSSSDIKKLNRIRFTKQAFNESINVLDEFISYNLNKSLKSYGYLKKILKNKNVYYL